MYHQFKAVVNGDMEFAISEQDLGNLDILRTSPSTFHILKDGKKIPVQLVQNNFQKRSYILKVHNESYEVVLKNDLDKLIGDMGFSMGSSKNVSSIIAPMPGLILELKVKEGEEVKEDDPLLILEAMKMENIITSPRDGIVKNITVKKGDTVDKKQLMISFE